MTTDTIEAPTAGPGIAPRDHNLPSGDELLLLVAREPELALTDTTIRDGLIAALRQTIADAPTSTETDADRKAIREAGRKVSSYKSAINTARLAKTKGLRDEVAAINAVGSEVDGELQALQDSVEAPLKAWKVAEDQRLATIDRTRATILSTTTSLHALPSSAIAERIAQVEAIEFPAAIFKEGTMAIEDERDDVLRQLRDAKAVAESREAQEAELAQLRAEREERAQAEAKRIADELAAKEAADREAARLAKAERDAAEAAAREKEASDRRVREEAERVEREAQARIDEANARAAKIERDAAAEREREAEQRRAEEAERQRIADAQAERERDQAHRAKVLGDAQAAIEGLGGITPAKAKQVVMAIAAGNVPAVSIQY